MDFEKFSSRIIDEYSTCDEPTADKIAQQAKQYHNENNSDKTVDDWISTMLNYNEYNAVAAWNYAVGFFGWPKYQDESPYKINQ